MLAVERSGSGVPLVFIHAFPLSLRMWDFQKSSFSRNFEFITVDLPGFGNSPSLGETTTMVQMAEEVLSTLDSLNITQKFILAGLSMGGYVLLPLLKLLSDRVRAVAFLSTRTAPDTPEARDKRFKNIEFIEKEGMARFAERMLPGLLGKTTLTSQLALVQSVREWIEKNHPTAVCAALRGMAARPDMTEVLDSLQVPALFLSGYEDGVVPSSEMEQMSKKVSKSEFHVIPEAGHLINLEKPTVFNDLFLHFLKRRVL